MTGLMETRPSAFVPDPRVPPVRKYSTTEATRLLCAGVYLNDSYRANVIGELYVARFRQVAPSYGYDVVPVLGHALAAHRLRGRQAAATIGAVVLFLVLLWAGALNPVVMLLVCWWTCWAIAFLARLSILETLMTRLRPSTAPGGFDGGYPDRTRLDEERVRELAVQQHGHDDVVYYGNFKPFVGAGERVGEWTSAVLLIPERANPLLELLGDDDDDDMEEDGYERDEAGPKKLIPFTVPELTGYLTEHLHEDLVVNPGPNQRLQGLVVEKREFSRAVARYATGKINTAVKSSDLHWEESYDARREYLCVRIGSWQEELVNSMFIGFDIRGNTLHMEFHSYALLPIRESFHLVDRLPQRFTSRLLGRVAVDTGFALPFEVFRTLRHPFAMRIPDSTELEKKIDRLTVKFQRKSSSIAQDTFRISRYAEPRINRGAVSSVRELAAQAEVELYFQDSDLTKYREVVQRSLLRNIENFLKEHNVDLADYKSAQSNILYQSVGNIQAGDNFSLDQSMFKRAADRAKANPGSNAPVGSPAGPQGSAQADPQPNPQTPGEFS